MRPILLYGHTRSLTKVKYNHDGDLIFSSSKDKEPTVWFSHNGERLGTFVGHDGAIWDLDVSYDSQRLLTASGDGSCIMWNVSNGKQLFRWQTEELNGVRAVAFAEGDGMALFVTDATMGQKCTICIVKIEQDLSLQTSDYVRQIVIDGPRASVAKWGKLNKTIITGHAKGIVNIWNPETGDLILSANPHTDLIQDLQFGPEREYFITASKDHTAKIMDATTLEVLKTYETERNVNSAAVSPLRPHVMLGGGQEAMNVTTTHAKEGKFEVRFFHTVFEEEIGRVKGHFGPINTLAFSPDGKSFASGGEDGFIRVHFFDADYFTFKYPEERSAVTTKDE